MYFIVWKRLCWICVKKKIFFLGWCIVSLVVIDWNFFDFVIWLVRGVDRSLVIVIFFIVRFFFLVEVSDWYFLFDVFVW